MPCPTLEFCHQLFAHGVATAASWQQPLANEVASVEEFLRGVDLAARAEVPAQAPDFDVQAAKWGLSVLAWSTCVLVDRAQSDTSLPAELSQTEPRGHDPSEHWSIDLAFRFLAGIMARVNIAAADEPLAQTLADLASRWPLACVGTKVRWLDEPGRIVISHDSLRRMLLDRILQRRDAAAAERAELQPYLPAYTHLLSNWPPRGYTLE